MVSYRLWSCVVALSSVVLSCNVVVAQTDVTTGYSSVVGVELDNFETSTGLLFANDVFPDAESPAQALDDNSGTKFLNFDGAGLDDSGVQVFNPTGLLVVLATPSSINGLQFTTANDFASRDPSTVSIYGISLAGSATELLSLITSPTDLHLVYSGTTGVPTYATTDGGRFETTPIVEFATSAVYSAYAVIITDLVRYADNAPTNFQFAEVSLLSTPTNPALLGDANNDGVVDVFDFDAISQNFGNTGGTPPTFLGDANDDGVVDVFDFDSVSQNFGNTAGLLEGGSVPEPSTIALCGLGGVALLGFARRK